ncbi:DUF6838 family protein [Cytobacillus firmus]|uniref:phage tail terminator family protein n=1 Tax=Cytobacillus firmus TaxID=1399 RepID=UPI0018CD5811|nr:hypothetical protein [Cytobacillus firmus]MBG9657822.1 hypothetical protein [Cytobacillus firmus]MED1904824.1 hypothetical protein [Cytobacillus firmus]
MGTDLKTLIIHQIKQVFGEEITVYDEPVRQGLKTPAFLVLIIHDTQERKLGPMSQLEYAVNVTYFPSDKRNVYSECDKVSQTFKEEFRYIGNKFHVHKMDAEKEDGTLVLTFNVRMLVKEIFDETKMQTLQFGGVNSE